MCTTASTDNQTYCSFSWTTSASRHWASLPDNMDPNGCQPCVVRAPVRQLHTLAGSVHWLRALHWLGRGGGAESFFLTLIRLASEGIVLNRHMAFAECTPSHQAFLAGCLPLHNGVVMREPIRWDGGTSPSSGYDGISPNITTLADKLQAAGYITHVAGKADGFGQATSG